MPFGSESYFCYDTTIRTSFSGIAYRGQHDCSTSHSTALTSLSTTARPAQTSAGSCCHCIHLPAPQRHRCPVKAPHAVFPIRLGLHTSHHTPHRHARSSYPREEVSREADDREQLRSDRDTPRQPLGVEASMHGIAGSATTSFTVQ